MTNLMRKICPITRAAEIFGQPWTIELLLELAKGKPYRFNDLLEALSPISPNTLSTRLKLLEEAKIINRQMYSQHPPRAEYTLTRKGRGVKTVLKAMQNWEQSLTD
jgi:DNA-binding HxlR family transcriptional regulator